MLVRGFTFSIKIKIIILAMYCLTDLCFLCLKNYEKLINVWIQDNDGAVLSEKLRCCLSEITLEPDIPACICYSCHTKLCSFYAFKRACLENYFRLRNYSKLLQIENRMKHEKQMEINLTNDPLENKHLIKSVTEEDSTDMKEDMIDSEARILYKQLLSDIKKENDSEKDFINDDTNLKDQDETFSKAHAADHEYNKDKNNITIEKVYSSKVNTTRKSFTINHSNTKNFDCKVNKNVLPTLKQNINENSYLNTKNLECTVSNIKSSPSVNQNINKELDLNDEKKSFECMICKKTFSLKSILNRHMKIHDGIKDFQCSVCDKKFSQRISLNRHMNIHDGVKNFQCTICDKKFTVSCNLNVHMKIHDGIKDFECYVCFKKFIYKQSLTRHVKTHHLVIEFECSVCNKKFIQEKRLNMHMKKHDT